MLNSQNCLATTPRLWIDVPGSPGNVTWDYWHYWAEHVDIQVAVQGNTNQSPGQPPTVTVYLYWSRVSNGNWTNPQQIQMTLDPVWSTTGNFIWYANLPKQSAGTRVEWVIHTVNGGLNGETSGEFWYKAGQAVDPNAPSEPIQPWGGGKYLIVDGLNFYAQFVTTPYVQIDYPTENEVITSQTYTFRMTAMNENNVRVQINGGSWLQCRHADDGSGNWYWWYDWSGYGNGSYTLVSESWDERGSRSWTSDRHFTVSLP